MTKKNKRAHKADEKTDTPITSNNKKHDDKKTPTKTTPSGKDAEMTEMLPKLLTYEDDNNNKLLATQTTAEKIIVHKGFTSIEWCASVTRCRNDQYHSSASSNPKYCLDCKGIAHPECLCEQGCLTCNKNIIWNSYTNRWVKLITSSTTSTKDSSLQKASTEKSELTNQRSTTKFGSTKWCGPKGL